MIASAPNTVPEVSSVWTQKAKERAAAAAASLVQFSSITSIFVLVSHSEKVFVSLKYFTHRLWFWCDGSKFSCNADLHRCVDLLYLQPKSPLAKHESEHGQVSRRFYPVKPKIVSDASQETRQKVRSNKDMPVELPVGWVFGTRSRTSSSSAYDLLVSQC